MSYLIVPMLVEAFLRGGPQSEDVRVPQASANYENAFYNSYLGSVNTPEPFNLNILPLPNGAHLHFILPKAFTRADKNGVYPAVPNRFLVTRLAVAPGGSISCARFMVESDFLDNTEGKPGQATIPVFDTENNKASFFWLGRYYPAETPPKDPSGPRYMEKLTAIGPGDPAFAAYYPNCRSVFGFHDDLESVPLDSSVSYFVAGCFSETNMDPLNGVSDEKSFSGKLAELGFSVSDGKSVRDRTLLYGAATGIIWKGGNYNYGKGIPSGQIDVSSGNTSAEALSAILREKLSANGLDERFITALQYGLTDCFDEIDGNFKIDDGIHSLGFSAVENLSGGVDIPSMDGIEHTGQYYNELVKLKESAGQAAAELACERRKLFFLWEQYMYLYEKRSKDPKPITAENLKREINKVINNIKEMEQTAGNLENKANSALDALHEKLPASVICKSSGGESYYLPKEPSVLLSGNGIRRSFAFGEDGRFTKDGTLLCQTNPLSSNAPLDKLLKLLGGVPGKLPVPIPTDFYGGLLCQTAYLCPDLKTRLEKELGAVTVSGDWSPVMLNSSPQNFTTLFMDWSVRFYPTRTSAPGNPDNTLEGWRLEYGETSYTTDKERSAERNIVYDGRTIVTPQAAYNMESAIKSWLEVHQDDDEVRKAAETLHQLPVISQTLGGLNQQLNASRHRLQFPVIGNAGDAALAAEVEKYVQGEKLSCVPSAETFSLRGGYFRVDRLNLIGTFGQVQHVIVPAAPGAAIQKIYYAETIASKSPDYGLISPGITVPARLSFRWTSKDSDGCISSPDPKTTPVCGFLLPELLNRRLLAYSNDGEYIGMLKTVYRNGAEQVRWQSAPGFPQEPGGLNIDTTLKAFISAMLGGDRFAGLMRLIDLNFEKSLQPSAALLIWGRPLVLARAGVQLLIQGSHAYTQSYEDFCKYNTQGVEKVRIPLHFGDAQRASDGMAALFPDAEKGGGRVFDKIYPAWGVRPFNNASIIFDGFPDIACRDGQRHFTVLMEAGSNLTVQTGLLPVKPEFLPAEHIKAAETLETAAELTCVLTTKGKAELPILPPGKPGKYGWQVPGEEELWDVVPVTAGFEKWFICDGLLVKQKEVADARR